MEDKLRNTNISEETKNTALNLQKATVEADKPVVEERAVNHMIALPLYVEKCGLAETVMTIFDMVAQLADKQLDSDTKNKIAYIISGNEDCLGILLNKQFTLSYTAQLKNTGTQGYAYLQNLLAQSSVENASKYIIMTLASCFSKEVAIAKINGNVEAVLQKLKQFDSTKMNLQLKRKQMQEVDWVDAEVEDERTEEEKRADAEALQKQIEELQEEIELVAGGDVKKYAEQQKAKARAGLGVFALTISGDDDIDAVENCHGNPEYNADSMVKGEIGNVVSDIMAIYKSALQIPITMGRFSGTYVFDENESNSGVMELEATGTDGSARLITRHYRGSEVLRWLREDYDYPIGKVKSARHNEIPSLENIVAKKFNYYPRFVTRYALGFVKDKKYTNFDKFLKAVKIDLEDRLFKIYKEKATLPDGKTVEGQMLFDRANEVWRKKLIGAFVNAVIFVTGSGSELFDSCQIRCISVLPHSNSTQHYTDFYTDSEGKDRGLSSVASQQYLEVESRAWSKSILDIIFIKDKEAFYNKTAWAYQELGKVYSTGDIPQVSRGESVVIGRTLSGELVDFNLGDNSAFVTSIFAGSRSGKGVTTLSILAAIMASRIGICYLDCKPDMAKCFWEIENRASAFGKQINSYSYDIHAQQGREGYNITYKPADSLKRACSGLSNASLAGALFLLKNLQLLTLTGQYKQARGDSSFMVWVIDEVNNMINMLESAFITLTKVLPAENAKPDSVTETQEYARELFKFWCDLTTTVASGVNDTYGQCGYKFLFIGQNPGPLYKGGMPSATIKRDSKGSEIIRIIGNAASNKYIYGRGLKNVYEVGSLPFHNDRDRTQEEKEALESHRYFVMRSEAKKAGASGNGTSADEILFQPFLTLNTDNVLATCWTGGIGKSKGYNSAIKNGTQGYEEMLTNYKALMNSSFGTQTEISEDVLANPNEGFNVVDEGTGFYGLLKTYFKNSSNPDLEVINTVSKTYAEISQILRSMKLLGAGSMFGYETIEDFLYDFSPEAMKFTSYDVYLDILENTENSNYSEESFNADRVIDADYAVDFKKPTPTVTTREEEEIEEFNYAESTTPSTYTTPSAYPTSPTPVSRNRNIETAETKEPVSPQIRERKGLEENAARINKNGDAFNRQFNYEQGTARVRPVGDSSQEIYTRGLQYFKNPDVMPQDDFASRWLEDIEYLDLELSRPFTFDFVNDAMIQVNIRKRYKAFVRAVKRTVGWYNVNIMELKFEYIGINGTKVYTRGGVNLCNPYETMNFTDLLFYRAKRITELKIDEVIAEYIVDECGYDVLDRLFKQNLLLEYVYVGNTKLDRKTVKNWKSAKELEEKANVKNSLQRGFFASIAEAVQENTFICLAKKFFSMTPLEFVTGSVASGLFWLGNLIKKAGGADKAPHIIRERNKKK